MIFAEFTAEFNSVQVESLYQWDEGEELKISGIDFGSTAPQVHFCNKKSETAIAVQGVLRDDGSVIASIPNSLLTEPYDITAYVYIKTAVSSNTIKCIVIPVIARKMPSDYVLTTDKDIVEIHEIELEAKAIIDNLTASEYSATTRYKRPNIVYYNNSAYMCKSSVAVTGVDPTDTTVWQLLCKDTSVSSIALNSSGDLVFTFDNGTSKTVAIPTIAPSLIETLPYATNAETANVLNSSSIVPTIDGKIKITETGAYLVTFGREMVEYSGSFYDEYYADIIVIPDLSAKCFSMLSTNISGTGLSTSKYVTYDSSTKELSLKSYEATPPYTLYSARKIMK